MDNLNSNAKCDENCTSHQLATHNVCLFCKALKDSPYHRDYLKNKSDKEIADEIVEVMEELAVEDDQ